MSGRIIAIEAMRGVSAWPDVEDGLGAPTDIPKGTILPYVGLREVRMVDEFGRQTMATAIYYKTIFNGQNVLVWPPHFKEVR